MTLKKNLWLFPVMLLSVAVNSAKAQLPPPQLAQQSTQTAGQSDNVSTIAQQVVSELAAQQYEQVRSSLHPDLRDAITAEDIQQQWQKLLEQRGTFKRIISARTAPTFDGAIVLVTVAFENGTDDLMVIFNNQQQIVGFDILQLNDANIQAIAEAFIDALAAGDYALARSNFHASLKEKVLPTDLEREWQATQATNGQFQRRLTAQIRPGSSADVVEVRVEFANTTADILVAFKNGRIAGYSFPQAPADSSSTP
ncbi:MAG TPA: DUF3887 domain-containing protein [Allocoleopsis sp.]